MRWGRLGWALAGVGVLVMVAASVWAPAQPEFLHDGASCEIAQCGMLDDPSRWRAAWWVWATGAVVAALGIALAASPRRRPRPILLAMSIVVAPLYLCSLVLPAWLVSLFTSIQGAATVYAVCAFLPFVAFVAGCLRGVSRRSTADEGAVAHLR